MALKARPANGSVSGAGRHKDAGHQQLPVAADAGSVAVANPWMPQKLGLPSLHFLQLSPDRQNTFVTCQTRKDIRLLLVPGENTLIIGAAAGAKPLARRSLGEGIRLEPNPCRGAA